MYRILYKFGLYYTNFVNDVGAKYCYSLHFFPTLSYWDIDAVFLFILQFPIHSIPTSIELQSLFMQEKRNMRCAHNVFISISLIRSMFE